MLQLRSLDPRSRKAGRQAVAKVKVGEGVRAAGRQADVTKVAANEPGRALAADLVHAALHTQPRKHPRLLICHSCSSVCGWPPQHLEWKRREACSSCMCVQRSATPKTMLMGVFLRA